MDAIVLCGGKGTRLSSIVSDVPKPLAPVAGRPFLDYLLSYLERSGFVSRVVLATGHLAQQVEDQYGTKFSTIPIAYSRELVPLGTGGAVLLALKRFEISSPFFIINGDSFIDADLGALVKMLDKPKAKFALALHQVDDAASFGTVELVGQQVISFTEKRGVAVGGLINAGIYVTKEETFDEWRANDVSVSLEQDILPSLVNKGGVFAMQSGNYFIDIGIPETYFAAPNFFKQSQIFDFKNLKSS